MGALDEGPLGKVRGALEDLGRNLPNPAYREILKTEFGLLPRAVVNTLRKSEAGRYVEMVVVEILQFRRVANRSA